MERSPQPKPLTATKLTQTIGYVHTSMVTYCSVTGELITLAQVWVEELVVIFEDDDDDIKE